MPITPYASEKDIEWRLPTNGAFIITDEVVKAYNAAYPPAAAKPPAAAPAAKKP